ncbi:MAG TPA: carboxypeptidase regulatory-like domain-containing protein [Gemmatimonadaceae bacterium]
MQLHAPPVRTRAVVLGLVLSMAAAPGTFAQSTLSGVVRDTLHQPLGDVEVMIASANRRVRTDSAGRFTLAGLDAGTYTVRVRRIGYYVGTAEITLGQNEAKSFVFEIVRRPIMLDTIQVTASCPRFEFAGFACRRRNGDANGVFFDVDAIDSVNPRFPIDMLRDIPGVRVLAARQGPGLAIESTHDWKCAFVTLANGKPPSLQNPLPQWPNELIGVEVYPTGKDVPAEYRTYLPRHATANSCGLVNYWTVVRPRKR